VGTEGGDFVVGGVEVACGSRQGVGAGGRVAGARKVKRGLCPGGLPIDRDFGEDFIALQQRGRREATWLVGEAFEASTSSVKKTQDEFFVYGLTIGTIVYMHMHIYLWSAVWQRYRVVLNMEASGQAARGVTACGKSGGIHTVWRHY